MTMADISAGGRSAAAAVVSSRPGALSIETFSALTEAAPVWHDLQAKGIATPFQTFDWIRCWSDALSASLGIEPLLVVCRDRQARPVALFPLAVQSWKGLRSAVFMGGKHANMNMGVFSREGMASFSRGELEAVLQTIGARHDVDLFRFQNQPLSWEGIANPMAALAHQRSPSSAWKAMLLADGDAMIKSLMSSESRKKLRHKEKRLGEFGPVSYIAAQSHSDVDEILAAFLDQKAARFRAMGVENPFEDASVQSFLRSASLTGLEQGTPPVVLFAMRSGSRILSVFGGSIHAGRFSGMFTSFDASAEVARYSPGDLLLMNLVRMMCARGVQVFDLGTGDAGYKNNYCDLEEPLFDSLLPMTAKGRVAATALRMALSMKRSLKKSALATTVLSRVRRLQSA